MVIVDGKVAKCRNFPNGEGLWNHVDREYGKKDIEVELFYDGDGDLLELMFVGKHLEIHTNKTLKIWYMPYGRMDRTHHDEEIPTLKYLCDMINGLNFKRVEVVTPHSDVTTSLLDRAVSIDLSGDLIGMVTDIIDFDPENDLLFLPDVGAYKRWSELPIKNKAMGMKKRDWESGEIVGLDVIGGIPEKGCTVIILDDICAYGGSAYYSGLKLKELGVGDIYLAVTHCENSVLLNGETESSKGLFFKKNNPIKRIFTTDSIFLGEDKNISVIKRFR